MRRWLVSGIGALALAFAALAPAATSVQGQNLVTLVRAYSQVEFNGCLTYVAQWSDGSYTVVPWQCPPGAVPVRNDSPVPAVRSYTERTRSGGIQFVALWADGVYTSVPAFYPIGLVPVKPGTAPVDAVAYNYGYGPYYWPGVPQAAPYYQGAPYGHVPYGYGW